MDSLIKQMRTRSSGVREKPGDTSSSREKRMPAKKSVSFKEEKKKLQNWFQRRFSRQTSGRDYDHMSDIDYMAAVAAAAFAITSVEETEHEKQIGDKRETVLTRPKSRREALIPLQEPGSSSKRFAGQGSFNSLGAKEKKPEKSPSIRKGPTFAINLDGSDDKTKPKKSEPKTRPDLPQIVKPSPPQKTKITSIERPKREDGATADAWEGAELAKIKQRYDKLKGKIASFEEKKKEKARRKLDRTESELDRKRKRALQKFRQDVEYIDQIVVGAKAQAEERRREEELQVKEKANIIRETGKIPASCFCF